MGLDKVAIRLKEVLLVTKFFGAQILTLFRKDRNLWLLSERGFEARDNAYFFFKWLKENHPEIRAKFILSNNSCDYERLKEWDNDIVRYGSLLHWKYLVSAYYLISTHIGGCTLDRSFFPKLDLKIGIFRRSKIVFLQHGITGNFHRGLCADQQKIDLFICGSKIEHDFILKRFGYSEQVARYTGFCRFDNLHDLEVTKTILVMPTWRAYVNLEHFEDSEYFLRFKEILTSPILANTLELMGYHLIFYPHYNFQSKIEQFKSLHLAKNVIIADMTYDVQGLLKSSSILITDYSSVFFDMMYMQKPILFYQFDRERFKKEHYAEGYLNYGLIGPVCFTLDDLLITLNDVLEGTKDMSSYLQYTNDTFPIRDKSNCERVFNAIKSLN